jgi:hypothetical protein
MADNLARLPGRRRARDRACQQGDGGSASRTVPDEACFVFMMYVCSPASPRSRA